VTVRQPRVVDPIEEELRRFDAHMHDVKGLAVTTRTQRLHILRSFLLASHGSGSGKIPSLDADRLRRFFARRLAAWSPASAQVLANTLRSYVRFRVACGDQVSHLLPVIASPAHWRLASLPKTLSTAEVTRLLTAFPSTLPSGRRAYAIVRCLVDLGLRGREVIGLGLDDIDWRAGTIRIARAKSRRADILPLPATTGAAIAAYVQSERPRTMSRLLFVRHVAPGEKPVGPDVVRRAVREAYRRCGLPYTRVHVLRHTLAGRLLESGSTLKEVADVLRHRDLDATLIYAKIDTTRLASVALPWPGSMP
jgi:integrase